VSYDGGEAQIPDPVPGAVERVIVIGAGIAGLTAANALTAAEIDTVVLEGRDRIGGRLYTADVGGSPIDMGGSWFHTPIGNPLRTFAAQADIACRPGNFVPDLSGYDRREQRRVTDAELAAVTEGLFADFPAAQSELGRRLGPDASLAQAADLFVAESGLEAGQARRLRAAIKFINEADATDYLEVQPAVAESALIEYEGDYLGDLPIGGMGWVTAAMASDVEVRLNAAVVAVAVGADGVEVTTADGTAYRGSHVIVTVPLGVLKHGDIEFSPPLEPQRRASIDRLTFGRFEKVALRFDRAFWRDADLSHLVVFPREPHQSAIPILDMDAFGCGPALVAFVFRSATDWLDQATTDEAAAMVCELMSEATGRPCPDPTAVLVSSWGADPYTRGAYTSIPLGASSDDIRRLAEPAHGRVLFAGEATSATRLGFADGAMGAGVREAKRLLQTGAVELTT
jgi:polyamine oxidase